MPYVMGGFPDMEASEAYLRALAPHADLIELGIPFSDPLADGPTIQAAAQRALDAGATPERVIDLAARMRGGPPIVVMTYANVIFALGMDRFMERAADAGVAGLIVPDVPIDEGAQLRAAARRAGLAVVPLAAPTTAADRLARICAEADGFVYCVSVAGVTGGDVAVGDLLRGFLRRARELGDAPLAVGFGIRTAEQVAAIGRISDGVIVASELIRRIEAAPDREAAIGAITEFARDAKRVLSDDS